MNDTPPILTETPPRNGEAGRVLCSTDLLGARSSYQTILADPPWIYTYDTRKTEVAGTGWRGAGERHYQTMRFDDIAALPVGDVATENATLWLWVVNPLIERGLELTKRWGFTYRGLVTWVKTTKDGNPAIGCGYWLRGATEHLMLSTRGKVTPKVKNQATWFKAGVGEHSAKPEQQYAIIERYSDGPYLEMFARRQRAGWKAWGNQIDADLLSASAPNTEVSHGSAAKI